MPLQLGLGLNRRLGGFNPFNPTHLNPHLLFDTRTSMLGELESPTLDLDAAVPSSLDVITATRSGVATYTDINGVIQSADPNTVRVDYTQGEELTPTVYQRVGYTDFSSGWILDGATKTNQSTPYGDGVLLTQDTSSGEHNIIIIISNTGQHTFSLKVKPNGVTKLSLSLQSSSANSEVAYDTVAGTATIQGSNVSDASIKDLGGGWFLVKLTNDSVVERARIRLRNDANLTSYVGDGASGLFLANPQVEEGTTATDFVPNTTGSPKFITGATFGPRVPMMLIEPSAENLVPYSEDFSQWNSEASKTLLNQTTSPDGLNNGAKLNASNVTNQSYASQIISVAASTAYTFSVYAKKGEQKYLCLVALNPFTESYFDLESGTALSNNAISSSIEDVGDGWFRLTATLNADTSSKFVGLYLSHTGNTLSAVDIPSGEGVYVWGAQLEEGSVATSYIPNPAPISDNLNTYTDVIDSDGSSSSSLIKLVNIANLNGKTCEVEFEVFDYVSGSLQAFLGNLGGATQIPNVNVNITANGVYRGVKTATSDGIQFRSTNSDFVGKIRNIRVVEVDTSGVRNADNLVIDGTDFTDFFNDSEGTFYVEGVMNKGFDGGQNYVLGSQSSSARFLYQASTSNSFRVYDDVTTSTTSYGTSGEIFRAAVTYDATSKSLSVNGMTNDSSHNGNLGSIPTALYIGSQDSYKHANTSLKRIIYWPTHSSRM